MKHCLFPQVQVILLHPSDFKKGFLHALQYLNSASVIFSSTACFAPSFVSALNSIFSLES